MSFGSGFQLAKIIIVGIAKQSFVRRVGVAPPCVMITPLPYAYAESAAPLAPASTTVVSPQVIYAQPAPAYVLPPVVYEPAWSYPVFSFGLDFGHHVFGHVFGHHGGHH